MLDMLNTSFIKYKKVINKYIMDKLIYKEQSDYSYAF